ncbi:TraR/DksA family transcriptional regulator [Patescibacteria group bacterium]|nr:TraR/DksA family transcriptional regulator [Patescibacteria group bacterium]MBU2259459.1 TraR/DksA family transcriptional regulator [Patescibacteria group bacterium]
MPLPNKPSAPSKGVKTRAAHLQVIQKRLINRRDAIRKAFAGGEKEFQEMRAAEGGDDLLEEQVDVASRLVEIEDRELRKVEEAIKLIQDGTYGECVACGVVIPLARLNALPYAERCITCQREFELEEG